MKISTTHILKTILAALLLALPASARLIGSGGTVEVGKWDFPRIITASGRRMNILGHGVLRYWGFKLYSAALYRESGTGGDGEFIDRPTLLILRYNRRIRADQIIEAAKTNLGKNPNVKLLPLRSNLKRMYDAFVDVDDGDEYALLYIPGQGTRLYFNGNEEVRVSGFEFAKAFFGIWLSDHPINEDLKRELWGENR
jgi:hypothetical protein